MTTIKFEFTPEEEKQLKAFVKEHPDLIRELRKPLEANCQQRKLLAPRESDIAALSALASRVSKGEKIDEMIWPQIVFVSASVYVSA